MEETSIDALCQQMHRSREEILEAADANGIPIRYFQDGRAFLPDEVRLLYGVLSAGDEVGTDDIIRMFPKLPLNGKKVRLLAERLGISPAVGSGKAAAYGADDASRLAAELEKISARDGGASLDPEWWPEIDDYVFLTEVNNCGKIYEAVRGMERPPVMDDFMD